MREKDTVEREERVTVEGRREGYCRGKIESDCRLGKYDIVITTYNIITAELTEKVICCIFVPVL